MPDEVVEPALLLHDTRPEIAETHRLLEELLLEVRGLPAAIVSALAERDSGVPISRLDRHLHAAIVPEIGPAVGDAEWSVAALLDHARKSDAQLLAAIDAAIGLDEGTSRRVGKLLGRLEGATLNGFRIQRIEERRSGTLWRVVQV